MKTIGLVGGTGWISTADYYRIINEEVNRRLGGLNFARCILYSLDFGEIDAMHKKGDTDGVCSMLVEAATKLVSIGADCILLCANTMHMHSEKVQAAISVPLIHIASATARQIKMKNMDTIGLLGTKMTMERDFYKRRLLEQKIAVIVPDKDEREFIDQAINRELVRSLFLPSTKVRFLQIIQRLGAQGGEGIVLGCTEIPLLIKQEDANLPLFNTTLIHSLAAVDFALETS